MSETPTHKVLVLGAGYVTKPLVHYLSNHCHYKVTLASRRLDKAQHLIEGAPLATAIQLDIEKILTCWNP